MRGGRVAMALSLLGCGAAGLTPAGSALPEGAAVATSVVLGPQGAQVGLAVPARFSEGISTHEVTGLPPGLEAGTLAVEGIPDLALVRVRLHATDKASLVAEAHGSQVPVESQPGASPVPSMWAATRSVRSSRWTTAGMRSCPVDSSCPRCRRRPRGRRSSSPGSRLRSLGRVRRYCASSTREATGDRAFASPWTETPETPSWRHEPSSVGLQEAVAGKST